MNHRSAKFLHEVKKLTVDWRARLGSRSWSAGMPRPPGSHPRAIPLDRNDAASRASGPPGVRASAIRLTRALWLGILGTDI
jgi:hypothetical protein